MLALKQLTLILRHNPSLKLSQTTLNAGACHVWPAGLEFDTYEINKTDLKGLKSHFNEGKISKVVSGKMMIKQLDLKDKRV